MTPVDHVEVVVGVQAHVDGVAEYGGVADGVAVAELPAADGCSLHQLFHLGCCVKERRTRASRLVALRHLLAVYLQAQADVVGDDDSAFAVHLDGGGTIEVTLRVEVRHQFTLFAIHSIQIQVPNAAWG